MNATLPDRSRPASLRRVSPHAAHPRPLASALLPATGMNHPPPAVPSPFAPARGAAMSLDPAAAALLAARDYDRLGVRRSEARPRVIRHAAHQLAGPLAQQHLRAPDGPTEDALAQVVTSAYRLLDPRRRSTPTERALLAQESSGPPIA